MSTEKLLEAHKNITAPIRHQVQPPNEMVLRIPGVICVSLHRYNTTISIYRYTLQVPMDVPPEQTRSMALKPGQEFRRTMHR